MHSILQITLPGLASVLLAAAARGEERPRPPAGESVRTPVTRDTWFSQVGREADANLGGAPRLKLKAIQEMSLIDINPKPLQGRAVQGATLHVRLDGNQPLRRVTVSSFGSE